MMRRAASVTAQLVTFEGQLQGEMNHFEVGTVHQSTGVDLHRTNPEATDNGAGNASDATPRGEMVSIELL